MKRSARPTLACGGMDVDLRLASYPWTNNKLPEPKIGGRMSTFSNGWCLGPIGQWGPLRDKLRSKFAQLNFQKQKASSTLPSGSAYRHCYSPSHVRCPFCEWLRPTWGICLPPSSLWFELRYITLFELKFYDPFVFHQNGREPG